MHGVDLSSSPYLGIEQSALSGVTSSLEGSQAQPTTTSKNKNKNPDPKTEKLNTKYKHQIVQVRMAINLNFHTQAKEVETL